jgi:hypothetical protein
VEVGVAGGRLRASESTRINAQGVYLLLIPIIVATSICIIPQYPLVSSARNRRGDSVVDFVVVFTCCPVPKARAVTLQIGAAVTTSIPKVSSLAFAAIASL